MEHKPETKLEKLLRGRAEGTAIALRGCEPALLEALRARFGGDCPLPLRLFEPCRVEHPHSAFLRKATEQGGTQALQTTLFAPGGKLHELRAEEWQPKEYFIKKPQDFDVLRGFLRDVELHPCKAQPHQEGAASLALLGLTPTRELETRWAGPDLARRALESADEAAASCLRKLERQLHRRAEEACRAGARACVLRDGAALPLPEDWLGEAARHTEWLHKAGLYPWFEIAAPTAALFAELAQTQAGAMLPLADALAEGFPALPAGVRLLLEMDLTAGLPESDGLKRLLYECRCAVLLLDCREADGEQLVAVVEGLLPLAGAANS